MSFQRPAFWRVPRSKPEGGPLRKKVAFGSPAGPALHKGDIISKIGNYDARDVRHQDAQNLFRNAGTNIKVVVQRDTAPRHNTSTASSRCSSQTPLSVSPNLSPRGAPQYNSPGGLGSALPSTTYVPTLQPVHDVPFANLSEGYYREVYQKGKKTDEEDLEHVVNQVGIVDAAPRHNTSTASSRCSSQTPLSVSPNLSPRGAPQYNSPGGLGSALPTTTYVPTLQPVHDVPFANLSEGYYREVYQKGKKTDEEDLEHVVNQPYRTTPLVLPGAKAKRDAVTESYLRHHPNPSVRSAPHVLDHDHFMKQRIVHKQFNSPIGMYSDANIVDTIKHQAGLAPKKFDPSLSECYKALQEEQIGDHVQEVVVPVQPKVFAPNKIIPGKKPAPYQQAAPQPYANSLGNSGEVIQQSGSFKRLMYHVMAESSF